MKESYERISPTAKLTAYLRTFSDIPFAKELAAESGAEKAFLDLSEESAKSMVRLAPYWEARYKGTNQILAEHGITQILEIAAGLSPRGLEMTRDPKIIYAVTDLPQILEEERMIADRILVKLNNHRPHLYYRAVNALDMESLSAAMAIFKDNKATAIIAEGLLPYFSRRENETLADNIRESLRRYGGIWIATDVQTKQYLQKVSQIAEQTGKRVASISDSTGTDIESNLFIDDADIEQFFNKAGFRMEEYSYTNMLGDLSSIKLLNLNEEEIRRVQQLLKIKKTLILTPQELR
jgi:O-methyltransferase involved in polyketide biosynthesis